MIVNRILAIGFLVAIHSNLAEGAMVSSLVNGSQGRSDADVQREAELHAERLNDVLALPMSTFLPISDSAKFVRTSRAAREIVKFRLELAGVSATKLLQLYSAAANHAPGTDYYSQLLNSECKRRMDAFKHLFGNAEIQRLFNDAQELSFVNVSFSSSNDKWRHVQKTLAELRATEIQLEDACAVLSNIPFNNAVEFFLDDDMYIILRMSAGLFREMVKILLSVGTETLNNHGGAALLSAARLGEKEIAKLLLDHGANVQNDGGQMALRFAAANGYAEIAELLLSHKVVDVDVQDRFGSTALMAAAVYKHADLVRLLLKHDAKVNVQDKNGSTALWFATANGYAEIAELLLSHKADVEVQDDRGFTVLSYAANRGDTEIVKLLLDHQKSLLFDHDAKVDFQSNSGGPALIGAAREGHADIVKLLLGPDANIDIQNKTGEAALLAAEMSGHMEIARLLRRRMQTL